MTKRTLGVSVYPDHSNVDEDKAYLLKASQHGFSRIFMSMLEVSGGKEAVIEKYRDLISYAKKLGYTITLDVAPSIFDQLGISYQDLSFFSELGADGIRLDEGFDGRKEAMISYNQQQLNIELNMSNDVDYLNNILSYCANEPFIYGCHNFYPQRGTGLPLDFFNSCSRRFKEKGIQTAAFITSQVGKIGPWSINDGLPTLEMHRDLPIELQAKHLFATGLIDCVIIGNAYASDEELDRLGNLNRYQVTFDVKLCDCIHKVEKEILLDNQHVRRGDITNLVVRSTEVRKKYKAEKNPKNDCSHEFKRGDIVIGNDEFGKYKNELQIVLQAHSDERKNKVAEISDQELFLLDYITPWAKFKLEEI
ncbi:MupG family TIM beta-alpha barrel fold protein [Companilactobacillus allii]|uniref:PTS-associated protein n=1 Tax=Companilactobacillus allii TaxID=1847728 RepID=A0A1P8Q0C1_9LACO|nr:MupG family TIM beta-alpha barrel fold protein [Companilactobacillus allii]APX71322.1 PTS-associated protein [Companilactobacillus allii]USQ68403.1 MupG family TIM beta-alpha barrel fold protein [Companilactobacillus allii]